MIRPILVLRMLDHFASFEACNRPALPLVEPKSSSHLVECDQFRKLPRIHQKCATHIFQITEDKGLLGIKPLCNDILGIL